MSPHGANARMRCGKEKHCGQFVWSNNPITTEKDTHERRQSVQRYSEASANPSCGDTRLTSMPDAGGPEVAEALHKQSRSARLRTVSHRATETDLPSGERTEADAGVHVAGVRTETVMTRPRDILLSLP